MPSRIDVTRKRPARWPWAVGAALVVLASWGITNLLAGPPEPEPAATVPTVDDTHPPSAIPLAPAPGVVHDTSRPIEDPVPIDNPAPVERDPDPADVEDADRY